MSEALHQQPLLGVLVGGVCVASDNEVYSERDNSRYAFGIFASLTRHYPLPASVRSCMQVKD